MHSFSSKHQASVCESLGISEEELRKLIRAQLGEIDDPVRWRSLEDVFEGKHIRTERTRMTLVYALHGLGFHQASEKWLAETGDAAEVSELCLPNFVAPSALVSPDDQRTIALDFGGYYSIYRRHGRNGEAVREVMYVTETEEINHEVFLVNRRGAVYRGLAYRINNIVYIYFFRPQARFKFAARSMVLFGTFSGEAKVISGVLTRITKSSGTPVTSDLIGLKLDEDGELQKVGSILSRGYRDPTPICVRDLFADATCPREFNSLDEMTEQEQRIVANLSEVVAAFSQAELDDLFGGS